MDYFAAVRTFVRVAERSSLTKAAMELGIKTSTASRHIADLEADLRIALFNRSTRGLALTEGGKVFHRHVTEVLEGLDAARDAAASLNRSPSGVLRVTMPTVFGKCHVLPHLAAFLARYREIDVDVVLTDDPIPLIESRIDLGIRIGALQDSSLMARKLAEQQYLVCASPDYLRTHGLPISPAALDAHSLLPFSRTDGYAWYVRPHESAETREHAESTSPQRVPGEWKKIAIHGRLSVNDEDALQQAALNGIGIALLPKWLASEPVRAGRLMPVLSNWEVQCQRSTEAIWAVYPRKKTVSSKVRSFIDFLVEQIGDPPYWE